MYTIRQRSQLVLFNLEATTKKLSVDNPSFKVMTELTLRLVIRGKLGMITSLKEMIHYIILYYII